MIKCDVHAILIKVAALGNFFGLQWITFILLGDTSLPDTSQPPFDDKYTTYFKQKSLIRTTSNPQQSISVLDGQTGMHVELWIYYYSCTLDRNFRDLSD